MKVGDLVRMNNKSRSYWEGMIGIISKVPITKQGRWAILLSSGELIATGRRETIEVISEN